MRSPESKLRRDALKIFRSALSAADAASAVQRRVSIKSGILVASDVRLRLRDFERIVVISAGKAAARMASAITSVLDDRISAGIVITKHGHAGSRLARFEVVEAAHPVPDNASLEAAARVQQLLRGLTARDLVILAVSGGASALLTAPADPVSLRAKQITTDLLLRAGATISELNAVRKHLSTLKGGQLAARAHPATVLALLLSDVIGDPLDIIGSGPAAPDPSTFQDALAVLKKFELLDAVPSAVRLRLEQGANGKIPETPKPGDPLFEHVHNVVIGSNRLALTAAAAEAKALGWKPLILSSTMRGETREVARVHAEILREIKSSGFPIRPPACVLSGGETTVTVRGKGTGGRNQEFALAAGIEIAGLEDVLVLSGGTDGTDGPTDAAGAIVTGATLGRAVELNLDPARALRDNNSYPLFEALGDLIRTGPTGTNVMDVHLLLAG